MKSVLLLCCLTLVFAAACAAQPPAASAPAPSVPPAATAPSTALAMPTASVMATASVIPTASSPSTSAAKRFRFDTLSGTDIRDVPFFMAMDALKAQGYTIEMTELANSTLVAAALARGDTDLASFNNQTAWDAIAKGSNIRTIVGRYVTSPLIVVKQELKTCADLDGKPVALNGTTGLTPLLFNLYLEQNCPGTKPQILTIAAAATRTAALESGAVDAAQAESQDIVELEHTVPGRFRTLVALGQAFPKVQSGGVHVRADWAKQNPGIVKDFVRALLTADRQVNDNHDLLFSQAVSRLGLDPAVAREAGTIQLGYNTWDSNGALTTDNVQYTLDFLAKSDSALAKLKIDDVADLSYLNAVLDDIGRK